jgi:Rrf2 family transcriptional regulator, nitric oxide-sensitive transcriptional repressor
LRLSQLAQQEYIETVRGRGGGIRLGHAPAQIRLGAVVRETEEELAVMGCLAGAGLCRIEGRCVLRGALRNGLPRYRRVTRRNVTGGKRGSR